MLSDLHVHVQTSPFPGRDGYVSLLLFSQNCFCFTNLKNTTIYNYIVIYSNPMPRKRWESDLSIIFGVIKATFYYVEVGQFAQHTVSHAGL